MPTIFTELVGKAGAMALTCAVAFLIIYGTYFVVTCPVSRRLARE